MNNLRDTKCYLSGPIENDDSGLNWRINPSKILRERFGIELFDPFSDPKQQWVPALKEARANRDHDAMVKIAKLFVRKDLCMVDRADFTIAYLPYKVSTTGTTHEIINSNNAKKPTLLVTDCASITAIPLWYFGFIPTEFMFAGWDALYAYLDEVDSDKHRDNNRWSYVCGDI